MDRQAWIAIALCIAGLIAWQVYMVKHPAVPPARALASPSPARDRSAGRRRRTGCSHAGRFA